MHPMYHMYQNMAVPSTFAQYPAIILPPNTGSSNSQYQPQKLQYNASTYYDAQVSLKKLAC